MSETTKPTLEDVKAVRMLVRLREDFQSMRKRVDNRIGRKADGTKQNVEGRFFRPEDYDIFSAVADEAHKQEEGIKKNLKSVLKRFPVYTEFLQHVKGLAEISAGWIIAEYDIHKASTVSKLWQFTGLNPGMVMGKKRVEEKDGNFKYVETGKMIPGDKLTPGHVAPFNKRLRTAMVGVLADNMIKACLRWEPIKEEDYKEDSIFTKRADKDKKANGIKKGDPLGAVITSPYVLRYMEEKERKHHSEVETEERKKGGKVDTKTWKECTDGHIDRHAKRVMIKLFLQDLYAAWREIEGLEVRKPYQEAYLGHKHSA